MVMTFDWGMNKERCTAVTGMRWKKTRTWPLKSTRPKKDLIFYVSQLHSSTKVESQRQQDNTKSCSRSVQGNVEQEHISGKYLEHETLLFTPPHREVTFRRQKTPLFEKAWNVTPALFHCVCRCRTVFDRRSQATNMYLWTSTATCRLSYTNSEWF